jgi:hypothetical protein
VLVHSSTGGVLRCIALAATGLFAAPAAAQRELTDIPAPDPVAERSAMTTDEQAAVNLFASDPDFSKPIQINFDSAGGLWIASSQVYPQIQPGEKANDQIVVLRDSDGDGISDSRTVFAQGLLIPTGVVPDGPHAAYVAESTRLLYLEDTDRDGKADQRRVVLSGFGTEDTHHLIHTLRFGPDGCLYFNQSIYIHSHIETPWGTRHLDGGGIWRYRPSTGRLEVFCRGFVNPWGHVFDHVGESFATDGAYFEGIHYVFPDSVFATAPGATRWLKGLNPGSPKHCGLEILSGTHIPPQWSGDLVANDFRSHRVCRFTVKPSDSGYVSRQQPEIITTQHVAFRPIDARMGPDGALYIADWYNPIIQHGEVDFRDPRRDRTHGRIWRVSFPGRPADRWPDFRTRSIGELLELLEDPALAVRQFARQELWQRADAASADVLSALRGWCDENPSSRVTELSWFSEVLDRPSSLDELALLDAVAPEARRTYLRSLWRRREGLPPPSRQAFEQAVLERVNSEDPTVRLEAVVCAGQLDAANHPQAIESVLQATELPLDENLDFASWQSVRQLEGSFAGGSVLTGRDWSKSPRQLAWAVSAIGTPEAAEVAAGLLESGVAGSDAIEPLVQSVAVAGNASQLGRVLASLLSADAANLSLGRLKPLLDRTSRDGTIPDQAGPLLAAAVAAGSRDEATIISTLARVAAVWKVEQLESVLMESVTRTSGPLREKVIEAIGAYDSATAQATLAALTGDADAMTRVAAVRAIASRRPQAVVGFIQGLLQDPQTAEAAISLIVELLRHQEVPSLLAVAIARQTLPTDLSRSLLRRVQSAGGNTELEQAIRTAGKLEAATWKWTPELQSEILDRVSHEGSAARGEAIYRREKLQCIQCHAIGSGGGLVGPNLISTGGSSPPDYILQSLLEPSVKLKEGYTTLTIVTVDAEVLSGIVVGQTEEAIRLRLADGKEVRVVVDDIESQQPGKSLMPEGLLDGLTQAELVDLTTFLIALGRDPAFSVSTEPMVRSLETLVSSDAANQRLNRTSTDTAASDDPALQWRVVTAKVDGTIPLSELDQFQQHRETPPTSFVRFKVKMPAAGTAKIALPADGIEAWVNRRPTPPRDLQSLSLPAGDHTIVLGLDRSIHPQTLAIPLGGDAVETQ